EKINIVYYTKLYFYFLGVFSTIYDYRRYCFLLGLLSGFELTVFRKISKTTINNGIMTGNTKNMMNHLFNVIFIMIKKLNKIYLFFFGVNYIYDWSRERCFN